MVGKLQWCCAVLPLAQGRLVELYRSRDDLQPGRHGPPPAQSSSASAWLPDVFCRVSSAAFSDLLWWRGQLSQPCARRFLWPDSDQGVLWGREVLPSLPPDSALFLQPRPYVTITSDASGFAGGAWWEHRTLHHAFTLQELSGPMGTSSNLRELYMVPYAIRHWGPLLGRGCRVLFRLDNQAAVGAVNLGASMSPPVQALLSDLRDLLHRHGVHLVARYLPGLENSRADTISRLRGHRDDQDWRLSPRVFSALSTAWGPFEVDACSDPLGLNSHCPVFWSAANSCLDHSWGGRHVYCNPPFAAIGDVLRHFQRCFAAAPTTTSAVFVLPVWPSESWWRLLAGAAVVAYFPAGSSLFTSPEWRAASPAVPVPPTRVDRGPTRWPVLMALFAPACGPRFQVPYVRGLRRLQGSDARDRLLLLRMSPGVVPCLRGPTGDRPAGDFRLLALPPPLPSAAPLPSGCREGLGSAPYRGDDDTRLG